MNFKESETLKNLMRAFAGESQARNRYTFAASLCRSQELYALSEVFSFTAGQEKEHAELFYNFMKEAAGETIHIDGGYPVDITNDVCDLLRRAAHNEFEESEPVYPAFAKTAEDEGFHEIAHAFREIASIEAAHGRRFEAFAKAMEEGRLFTAESKRPWMCLNCGYILEVAQAPQNCPVCRHPQGYFIPVELAPWSSPRLP